jgi:phospholipid transport system transporter-binding protein
MNPTADLTLPATLRHPQVMAWLSQCRWPDHPSRAWVLDASPLQSFDSSALACLIEARRRVTARGGELTITGLPDRLQRLAQVYGLADLL